MQIAFTKFKELVEQYNEIANNVVNGTVCFKQVGSYYDNLYAISFSDMHFNTVEDMYLFGKRQEINIPHSGITCVNTKKVPQLNQKLGTLLSTLEGYQGRQLEDITKENVRGLKTIRLIPDEIPAYYRPWLIANPPLEITEGNHTYRILSAANREAFRSGSNLIELICREDEPLYDYLDAGYYLSYFPVAGSKKGSVEHRYVATNSYDINSAHILMMCTIQTELVNYLTHGCFINAQEAELLRLKLAKKLTPENKKKYQEITFTIDNDNMKNTTLLVVGKLCNGSVESTELRNITFTKTKATYERISIEADDLLDTLLSRLDFTAEFDIYTICTLLANKAEADIDSKIVNEGQDFVSLNEFKVNGIPIVVSVNKSGQRFINKIRINKDEIAKAIHRASCYQSKEEYTLFLKSISRMSMKLHDVVANGLPMKIHDMTREEYKEETPGPTAPALKFHIDKDDGYKLEVSKTKSVKIKLVPLLKKIESINKRTDNGYAYPTANNSYRSSYRNNLWAIGQIVHAISNACTFEIEEKLEDGTSRKRSVCHVTRDDLTELLKDVQEAKNEAIERSKIFMKTAVDMTGAELIEFMGRKGYKVQGSLRSYVVMLDNAKVYDFETKQYRCVVNDSHYTGAGYDDVATRLLALKNDSVMQESVTTLRGAAQPQYENAHNHTPEREAEVNLASIIDTVLTKN